MHFLREGFAFPEPLSKALIDALWQGRGPDAAMIKRSAVALSRLWPALAKERGQVAVGQKHYSADDELAQAYAAYYLPANAMKPAALLEEMRLSGIGLNGAVRWLDVGCGPGTAFFGAAWWASRRGVALEYTGLDQSRAFLRASEALSAALLKELGSGSARFEQFSHQTAKARLSLASLIKQRRPHVLSFMNSVAELAHDTAARGAWVSTLIDELSLVAKEEGSSRWLFLVEPGSKASSRELLALRDRLRSRPDVRIWLPCLNGRQCGALANSDDWCHEEVEVRFPEWVNRIGAEAGLRKEAMLFSYLVCSVGIHPPVPVDWPSDGRRVVSQVMREKGLNSCFFCGDSGKVKARVLNSRRTDENAVFSRTARGCVYRQVSLSEKGDVLSAEEVDWSPQAEVTVFPPLE